MFHPSRGGVRGGKDQFNWEDVKGDKHRENYLGHSLKAPVGRWQKGKDLTWYAKDNKSKPGVVNAEELALQEEKRRFKEEEEQMMREALGLAPARVRKTVQPLEKREVEELLRHGRGDDEPETTFNEADRVAGLGYGPSTIKSAQVQVDHLPGVGAETAPTVSPRVVEDQRAKQPEDLPKSDSDRELSRDERKRKRKEEKHEAKRLRKEVKEERRAKREERREERREGKKRKAGD